MGSGVFGSSFSLGTRPREGISSPFPTVTFALFIYDFRADDWELLTWNYLTLKHLKDWFFREKKPPRDPKTMLHHNPAFPGIWVPRFR